MAAKKRTRYQVLKEENQEFRADKKAGFEDVKKFERQIRSNAVERRDKKDEKLGIVRISKTKLEMKQLEKQELKRQVKVMSEELREKDEELDQTERAYD